MNKQLIHGIAAAAAICLVAAFAIVDNQTADTVLAVLAAVAGVIAYWTRPAAPLAHPEQAFYDKSMASSQGKVIDYDKQDGIDGISTVRTWALDAGARLEVTVDRLGTLSAPLSITTAKEISKVLDRAGGK